MAVDPSSCHQPLRRDPTFSTISTNNNKSHRTIGAIIMMIVLAKGMRVQLVWSQLWW
jgi:hypothetical protein